ncbi:MAG: hypothetical protein KGY45_04925 [Hadesarchaea archaeon]|nr:hypothetical protein [Hadesarchaea archaeon]
MSEKVNILTHKDVDGLCSAALATTVFSESELYFAEAYYLASKLDSLPKSDRIIIMDLGINPSQKTEVMKSLKKASEETQVTYIDHHKLPKGVTKNDLPCDEVFHRTDVSASELALEYFEPPLLLENIALMGAIGDWQEDTPRMSELIIKHGERISRLETILLEQAIGASKEDPDYLKKVVRKLAEGVWPSSIPEMMGRARSALEKEREVKEHTSEELEEINDRIALVREVPHKATGRAATYALRFENKEVGVGAYEDEDHMRVSMRRSENSSVDLNEIIRESTLQLGGTGGGHAAAVGGKIPIQKFDKFVEFVKKSVKNQDN